MALLPGSPALDAGNNACTLRRNRPAGDDLAFGMGGWTWARWESRRRHCCSQDLILGAREIFSFSSMGIRRRVTASAGGHPDATVALSNWIFLGDRHTQLSNGLFASKRGHPSTTNYIRAAVLSGAAAVRVEQPGNEKTKGSANFQRKRSSTRRTSAVVKTMADKRRTRRRRTERKFDRR